MAVEVKVPDIGDFTDVPVIEVLVSVGDRVEPETPLITLESEKATMDVPSPEAGVVEELLVEVGDEVSEGTPILRLGEAEDEPGEEAPAEEEAPEKAEEGEEAPAEEEAPEKAEEGEEAPAEEEAPEKAEEKLEAEEEKAEKEAEPEAEKGPAPEPSAEAPTAEGPVYASPSARRLARERGIELSRIDGSGREGRITREDVERAARRAPAAAPAEGVAIPGLDLAPWPTPDFSKHGEIERVERSRIKRIAAPNLARNWVHIPHVTQHDEADVTELEEFRKRINSEQDVKVTMVALLLKACVPPLKRYPEFNASLEIDGGGLILKRYYHLGFAVDTPEGLVVPVIRDVDRKGLLEIAAELIELSGVAREGKLSPAQMSGATFTISSLGGIGGTAFTPIVNAPEVAILGASRSQIKPVWTGEEFEPRLIVPLSLSYDHRVVDGAAAARFCVYLGQVLSDLKRALL